MMGAFTAYTLAPLPVLSLRSWSATKNTELAGIESGCWKSSSRYSTMELPTGSPEVRLPKVTVSRGPPLLVVLSDSIMAVKSSSSMSAASAMVMLAMPGFTNPLNSLSVTVAVAVCTEFRANTLASYCTPFTRLSHVTLVVVAGSVMRTPKLIGRPSSGVVKAEMSGIQSDASGIKLSALAGLSSKSAVWLAALINWAT